jgi:hypothetical protein
MLRLAPPALDAVTTSRTCLELVEVNTLTTSGMIAPASVPRVMISDSCHHRLAVDFAGDGEVADQQIRHDEGQYQRNAEVIQTSEVNGASKSKRALSP